ncbi:unnamed protein product, partial [Amoebophrya sp. A25]|eukprot:GSA25T00014396001.1
MRLESNIIDQWTETRHKNAKNMFTTLAKVCHKNDPRAQANPQFMDALKTARTVDDTVICEIEAKRCSCNPKGCIKNTELDRNNPMRTIEVTMNG